MSMNFPAPAVPGQIYVSPGGPVYRFDAPVWTVIEEITTAPLELGLPGHVTPYMFGGVGDGVADDRLAIQLAIDYCFNTWRSGTVDMSGGRWLVDSADIQMKAGVFLVGSWNNAGNDEKPGEMEAMHFEQWKSSIVLNPLYTIRFAPYDSCGLKGLTILRKGLTTPTSIRAAVDSAKAFSGVAVTLGDGTLSGNSPRDTYFGYCFVVGFEYAYKANGSDRMHIEHIQGDCTNGIYISKCYDMEHISHCHFWPFATSNYTPVEYAVSGAVNNGSGLIRLTVAANVLMTGDIVTVTGVGGTTEANGKWTVTAIDATHVDLQGSAFANAYTSGGGVWLSAWLRNRGYWFDVAADWGQLDHCFCYNYAVGFDIVGSHHTELLNCGADNYSLAGDTASVGIRIKDSQHAKLIGCKTAAHGTGVLIDAGTGFTATITAHDCWGLRSVGVHVLSGSAILSGSLFNSMPTAVLVDPGSDGIHATGNRVTGGVTTPIAASGVALRRSTILANSWVDASAVGNQQVFGNTNRDYRWAEYSDTATGVALVGQKARGSFTSPTAAVTSDAALYLRADFWDGVDRFRTGGSYRIIANGTISSTSVPSRHYWGVAATGSTTVTEVMGLQSNLLYPTTDLGMALGSSSLRWASIGTQYITLADGIATPTFGAGNAAIYIDSADGSLKVKFGSGTVKTITTDP